MRMKIIIFVLFLSGSIGFAAENYDLEINGHTVELGLGQEKIVALPNGEEITLKLTLKDFVEFQSEYFSFSHKNTLTPSKSDLGDGTYQTVMYSPLGTAIMLQEYTTMNPTHLIDLMLQELTKEEIDYGYEYEESELSEIIDGKILEGKKAVTTYQGDKWTRCVYTCGAKDKGILIVTMINEDYVEEKPIIEHFWKSLKIKL